jgi:hypothetical protein
MESLDAMIQFVDEMAFAEPEYHHWLQPNNSEANRLLSKTELTAKETMELMFHDGTSQIFKITPPVKVLWGELL